MEDGKEDLTKEEILILENALKYYGAPQKDEYLNNYDVNLKALNNILIFYIKNKTKIKLKLNNGQYFIGLPMDISSLSYIEESHSDLKEKNKYLPITFNLLLDSGTIVCLPINHINQQSILPIELEYTSTLLNKRPILLPKKRFEVLSRDNYTCQYCGRQPPEVILEIDHKDPWSNSQNDDISNLITSCRDCNRGKSNRIYGEGSI